MSQSCREKTRLISEVKLRINIRKIISCPALSKGFPDRYVSLDPNNVLVPEKHVFHRKHPNSGKY